MAVMNPLQAILCLTKEKQFSSSLTILSLGYLYFFLCTLARCSPNKGQPTIQTKPELMLVFTCM